MTAIPQYVFGPLMGPAYNLFLVSYMLSGSFYILQLDPDQSLPPFFGILSTESVSAEILLNTVTSTLKSQNGGLTHNEDGQPVFLSSSVGKIEWAYPSEFAQDTALLSGTQILLSADGEGFVFKAKTVEMIRDDVKAWADSPDTYEPTYMDETVERIIYAPVKTWLGLQPDGQRICRDDVENLTIQAYTLNSSDTSEVERIFSSWTTEAFCVNDIHARICPESLVCGDDVNGIQCFGPCRNNNCVTRSPAMLSCGSESKPDEKLTSKLWFKLLMAAIIFGVIISVFAGVYFLTK